MLNKHLSILHTLSLGTILAGTRQDNALSTPLRWLSLLLTGRGAQDLPYLAQASDVSRSKLPEIDRHYDAVFPCGNPHVPFSSDVGEGKK